MNIRYQTTMNVEISDSMIVSPGMSLFDLSDDELRDSARSMARRAIEHEFGTQVIGNMVSVHIDSVRREWATDHSAFFLRYEGYAHIHISGSIDDRE